MLVMRSQEGAEGEMTLDPRLDQPRAFSVPLIPEGKRIAVVLDEPEPRANDHEKQR